MLLSLSLVLLLLETLVAFQAPSVTPLHLNHQERDHSEGDTRKQEECPLSTDSINNWLRGRDTGSADQASHQVVDSSGASTRTGIQVNHESTVHSEDSSGSVRNDKLQNDWHCDVSAQRDTVDSNADNEDGGDPPGVAHTSILDGEVGVRLGVDAGLDWKIVLLAVLALGPLVVVVHQVSDCVRSGHASESVSEEGQANLEGVQTILLFEQVGGRRGDHRPDSVDDTAVEQGDEYILLAQEGKWCQNSLEGDFVFLSNGGGILIGILLASDGVDERSVDTFQRDGAITSDGAQSFWEEDQNREETDA